MKKFIKKKNGWLIFAAIVMLVFNNLPSSAQNKETINVKDNDVLNAVAFYEKDDFQKAKSSLDVIILKCDNNADAHYALGIVLTKLNKLDDAEDEVKKAIELNGSNAEYHYGLAKICMLQLNQASIFSKMSWAGSFRDELNAALKIDPNHRLALSNLTGFYTQAPSIAGGDLNKALELANRLLKLDEKQARIFLVQIYNAKDNSAKANEEVNNLIKIDEYTGRIMLIQGLKKKGDLAKVEEQYNLIEVKYGNNPDYFAFFNDYGYFLLGQKRIDEAIEKLKKQVALAPKSANAHDSLGEGLLAKNMLKESLAEYTKAVELNPGLKSAKDKIEEIKKLMEN